MAWIKEPICLLTSLRTTSDINRTSAVRSVTNNSILQPPNTYEKVNVEDIDDDENSDDEQMPPNVHSSDVMDHCVDEVVPSTKHPPKIQADHGNLISHSYRIGRTDE